MGVGELILQKHYLRFQGALIAGCVHLDVHDTLLPSGPRKLKRKSKDSKCKFLKPGLSKGGAGHHRSYFILLDLMIYTQLLFSSFILSHRFCFSVFLSSRGIQNKGLWGLTVCKVHNKNRYLRKRGGSGASFYETKARSYLSYAKVFQGKLLWNLTSWKQWTFHSLPFYYKNYPVLHRYLPRIQDVYLQNCASILVLF